MKNSNGLTIVEMLVALAISGIVISGMISIQLQQHREARYLSDKMATLDLERTLISELSDGSTCQHILNTPVQLTFDSLALPGAPQYLTPTLPLYSKVVGGVPGPALATVGALVSATSGTLRVAEIKLKVLSGVGNMFKANWEISFSNAETIRAIRAISISTMLVTDISNPSAVKVLTCSSNKAVFSNITYHSYCNTGAGGTAIKPLQPNRICTLSAMDDDVGNTALATTYKCMISNDGTNWIGTAELTCGQVACRAMCFDLQ